MQIKRPALILLFCLLVAGGYFFFPWLFGRVVVWQREFNALLSDNLHQIRQDPVYAGGALILISFLYGVFHALGPGHGKFIITGYLATHQSRLAAGMKLTFLSSLMQGAVAITATSVIVVALNLSSAYFKLGQLWLERAAFGLILLLGIRWCGQSLNTLWRQRRRRTKTPKIQSIKPIGGNIAIGRSAVENPQGIFSHQHNGHCGCGHRHIPDQTQLENADSFKSRLLVVLSIGMRPCTGAVFILFLSYMLDLYYWGIAATMAMSLGTGITLSAFALLVLYARQTAVALGKWYLSPQLNVYADILLKLGFGILLIVFAAGLLYGTTLPSGGGAVLLGR